MEGVGGRAGATTNQPTYQAGIDWVVTVQPRQTRIQQTTPYHGTHHPLPIPIKLHANPLTPFTIL